MTAFSGKEEETTGVCLCNISSLRGETGREGKSGKQEGPAEMKTIIDHHSDRRIGIDAASSSRNINRDKNCRCVCAMVTITVTQLNNETCVENGTDN